MGIAPSEKHLEDWIVSNPDVLWCDDEYSLEYMPFSVVKRQLVLPSGRLDLLLSSGHGFYVTELKKGAIDAKALAQVLRYMGDLHRVWIHALSDLSLWPNVAAFLMESSYGMLVGSSISDDILIAANAANISVVLYDYDDGMFQFEGVFSPLIEAEIFQDYARGYLGVGMRNKFFDFHRQLLPPNEFNSLLKQCEYGLSKFNDEAK